MPPVQIADPPPVTRYDDYLYDEMPITESHPAHIGAIAWLLGIRVPPLRGSRVLELGCALGGNLIPMAANLPESYFVGVDLSPPQVEIARQNARGLGLDNIEFDARDIMEVTPDIGTFDYILCHGVYSWVPLPVQAKILEICGQCLTPNGIAYISFNTYPGWHLRGGLRDMLRRAVGPHGTPAEKVARARDYMAFLEHIPNGHVAQLWFKGELEIMKQVSDKYIYYEHLVDINLPSYFEEFAADAARCGLAYVGDAHIPSMYADRFGEEAMTALKERSKDVVECEQNLDLLEVRYFRRALLCRDDVPLDRNVAWNRLEGLIINTLMEPASAEVDIKSDKPETFRRSDKIELETTTPLLKAAFKILADERPRGLPFREACARARALLDDAPVAEATIEDMRMVGHNFAALCLRGHLDPALWAPAYVLRPSARPVASPLVRYQAENDYRWCTNLKHDSIKMDRFDRCMLKRMDGSLTRDELIEAVLEDARAERVRVEVDGAPSFDHELFAEIFDKKLEVMAKKAIIIG